MVGAGAHNGKVSPLEGLLPLSVEAVERGGAGPLGCGVPAGIGPAGAPQVRLREIDAADVEPVTDLLTSGFAERSRAFWLCGLRRMAEHTTPSGYPKFGYLLESDGRPVGVILLIYSAIPNGERQMIRCCVSSWYVAPDYRSYATMITAYALRRRETTYVNLTPDRRTWRILEAQGWKRYCEGRLMAVPAIAASGRGIKIRPVSRAAPANDRLPDDEAELLLRHAAWGCLSIVCIDRENACPFVFQPFRIGGVLRCAHLVYCRDIADFVRFAGAVGRFLLRRGIIVVQLDADGPVGGLFGKYLAGAPKYFKGPDRPALGDIAYSERVMFGF